MGTLLYCWWEFQKVQLLWKTIWQFLKKLNIELLCNLAIPLLPLYPRELKIYVHAKICTQIFIAAWFIIAKKWNHPKYPSADEWRNKIWCIHTYPKKEWSIDTSYNMDETFNVVLNKKKSSKKCHMSLFIWKVLNRQIHRDRKHISCCHGWEEG